MQRRARRPVRRARHAHRRQGAPLAARHATWRIRRIRRRDGKRQGSAGTGPTQAGRHRRRLRALRRFSIGAQQAFRLSPENRVARRRAGNRGSVPILDNHRRSRCLAPRRRLTPQAVRTPRRAPAYHRRRRGNDLRSLGARCPTCQRHRRFQHLGWSPPSHAVAT